jgi:hypothetical protein
MHLMDNASAEGIERPSHGGAHRAGLFLVLFCCAISLAWGWFGLSRTGLTDFRAVYYGTRCLIAHHNPYRVSEFEEVYRAEGGQRPSETFAVHQAVTLFVNMPTTCVVIAPLALLPWGPAHVIWMVATAGIFILAVLLIWNLGARHAPGVATLLACLLAANCEVVFGGGNTAGIVVGLCVAAVWCFMEERFVLAGVVALGLALAMKPHDAGLIWLYFLAVGAPYRKRALQAMAIPAVVGVVALIWVGHVAPHWMHDWNANMATISGRDGINNPAPDAVTGRSSGMVIDLQAAFSVFRDDPAFYNPASYCICGVLLLMWLATTLRSRFSLQRAWLALASVTALTLLITYHRPWDGKLLLLAIPACCLLWAEGGRTGRIAMAVTSLALVCTGDLALAILSAVSGALHVGTAGIFERMLTVVLIRPASIALFALGVFYLWVYARNITAFGGLTKTGKRNKVALALDAAGAPALAERRT